MGKWSCLLQVPDRDLSHCQFLLSWIPLFVFTRLSGIYLARPVSSVKERLVPRPSLMLPPASPPPVHTLPWLTPRENLQTPVPPHWGPPSRLLARPAPPRYLARWLALLLLPVYTLWPRPLVRIAASGDCMTGARLPRLGRVSAPPVTGSAALPHHWAPTRLSPAGGFRASTQIILPTYRLP